MAFKKIDDLYDFLEQEVANAMSSEKYIDEMKDVMVKNIKSKVYKAYTPKYYVRRKENGGLIDKDENIKGDYNRANMELSILNVRVDKKGDTNTDSNIGRYVTPIVVSGDGYTFTRDNGYDDVDKKGRTYYKKSRDFISASVDELEKTGQHVKALKRYLKSKGYKMK
jgi:hypothetical protein